MKKAILLISFLIFPLNLISENKDYFFYKDNSIFLNPIIIEDKNLTKILNLISQKKFKTARKKLCSLKLEVKDKQNCILLEKFITFLEEPENNGRDLLPYLKEEIATHQQIKGEIFWLSGKKIESFSIYNFLPKEILNKVEIKKHLEKRIIEFCDELKFEIDETLEEGNFDKLCNKIEAIPEDFFEKNENYNKGKTICAILKREPNDTNKYYEKLDDKDRKELNFFKDLFNLELGEQLKRLKDAQFDKKMQKISKYLYNKIEDKWLLDNMPTCYQKAYYSKNITLKELALLFCLYFPQIKGEIEEEVKENNENLDPYEIDCLYPLFLAKILEKNSLNEKLEGDNFIYYLKKFVIFLNLLVPCNDNWDSFVKCGLIPIEKDKAEIEGEFAASVIRKMKGEM